jgi:hypothetical protein
MIAPKLAAFGAGTATNLSLALPVATPVSRQPPAPLYPRPKDDSLWTEAEWERHVAGVEGDLSPVAFLILAGLVLLPLVVALLLDSYDVYGRVIVGWIIGWAVLVGFWLARRDKTGLGSQIARGLVNAVALLVVIAILGVGILFIGCATL